MSRFLLILLIFSPTLVARKDPCSKIQPTLEAYMRETYGDPSRTVWPSIPKDGPVCEKLRKDRNVYKCWIGKARYKKKILSLALRSTRPGLRSARKARPDQVGGPAAKARSIAGLSRLLFEQETQQRKAQADLALAKSLRDEVELELEKLDCRFTKPKPWER